MDYICTQILRLIAGNKPSSRSGRLKISTYHRVLKVLIYNIYPIFGYIMVCISVGAEGHKQHVTVTVAEFPFYVPLCT